MRRRQRPLFRFRFNHVGRCAAAVSLVLLVATVALWVRSYWYRSGAGFNRRSASEQFVMNLNYGKFTFVINAVPEARLATKSVFAGEIPADPHLIDASKWTEGTYFFYEALGFSISYPSPATPAAKAARLSRYVAVVPMWFVAVMFALLPAVRWRSCVRRRPRPGNCVNCGYDLRATPERCPECGTAPPAAAATTGTQPR
jgi:hypothetical protein